MFKNILIATDGSEHSKKAVELGASLAAGTGGQVVLVHVLLVGEVDTDVQRMIDAEFPGAEPALGSADDIMSTRLAAPRFDISLHRATSYRIFRILGDQIIEQAIKVVKAEGVDQVSTLLLEGNPAEQILNSVTDVQPDVVICGARGLSRFSALLLGSVSNKIAQLCPVTCVTVR